MSCKGLVLLSVLCLFGSCWSDESSTQDLTLQEDIPMQSMNTRREVTFDEHEETKDPGFWRLWNFWKLGRSMMRKAIVGSADMSASSSGARHHIHEDRDSQKTVTRRDSSLITQKRSFDGNDDLFVFARPPSTARLTSESIGSVVLRPWGSVQKEVVTSLFENMLDYIVKSWDVIAQPTATIEDLGKVASDSNVGRKKKPIVNKTSKTKRSRSKLDLQENVQPIEPINLSWWSSPDEKAIICFKNGNMYEGNISWKCMQGEGRFQWADGTAYLGNFCDNQIKGKGLIHWKDDMWYQGDFAGNLRHGQGIYVDSRRQRSYVGGWHCGTKHGKGAICYSENNSYDGDWINNVRTGYGVREYDKYSGYMGEWERNIRQGEGTMIWPNNDYYKGEWNNAVMHGYGVYVWNIFFNNSMSLPSINVYRGFWERGERNGYGVLNLGMGLGSFYMGMFTKNKKHGTGKIVTNNGFIYEDNSLFCSDVLGPVDPEHSHVADDKLLCPPLEDPYQFNICDDTVGLKYHIIYALKSFDKQEEVRIEIINTYIENNKYGETRFLTNDTYEATEQTSEEFENFLQFEKDLLRNAIRNYLGDIKNIYYQYATICNTESIQFTPILIRLFLWQFFYDLNVHQKGLKLIDIDRLFAENKDWLIDSPHCPFEKIYFWQFINILIAVANKLYAKKYWPGPRPETILAEAFRTFMETDVLPGVGRKNGHLVNEKGLYVPLKAMYALYCKIGEPHTIRTFIQAVRKRADSEDVEQPDIIETTDENLPLGRNKYVFRDEMIFILDEKMDLSSLKDDYDKIQHDSMLFNISNLSIKSIIQKFSEIYPEVSKDGVIVDLDIDLTFFEFNEVILSCIEESIRVKEEEIRWREKFIETPENDSPNSVRNAVGKVESMVTPIPRQNVGTGTAPKSSQTPKQK